MSHLRLLLLVVISGLVFGGCSRKSGIAWYTHTDYATTMAKAAKHLKPIFFKFDADWCPYCMRLEETLFQDADVQKLAKQYFCVRVDGDRQAADRLMAQFHVQGYPTLIFTLPNGEPLGAWQDLVDTEKFRAQLQAMAKTSTVHASWQMHLDEALPGGPLPTERYFDEAKKLADQGDAAGAQRIYRQGGLDFLGRLTTDDVIKNQKSQIGSTITLLMQGEAWTEAEELARRVVAVLPEDFLAYYRLAKVLQGQDKVAEAVAQAQEAYRRSYGRNRLWVTNFYTELLVTTGATSEAKTIIQEVLNDINWEDNPRKKAIKYRQILLDRLQILQPPALSEKT